MHTVTLKEIHRDPAILDRALQQHEPVEIVDQGKIAGTLVPATAAVGMRRSQRGFSDFQRIGILRPRGSCAHRAWINWELKIQNPEMAFSIRPPPVQCKSSLRY